MHIVKQNGRHCQIGHGLLGEDGRAPSMPGWRAGEWPGNKNEHGAKPHTPIPGSMDGGLRQACARAVGFPYQKGKGKLPHYWERGSLPAPAEGGFDCQDAGSARLTRGPSTPARSFGRIWGMG